MGSWVGCQATAPAGATQGISEKWRCDAAPGGVFVDASHGGGALKRPILFEASHNQRGGVTAGAMHESETLSSLMAVVENGFLLIAGALFLVAVSTIIGEPRPSGRGSPGKTTPGVARCHARRRFTFRYRSLTHPQAG
jgi:hypothetical protein